MALTEILIRFLQSIEPFTLLLALLPLIAYLLVFSLIRLSGRALVTTGGRDTAALSVAIAGLLAVGPAELFFPTAAANVFGPGVWFAVAAFYGLSVTLIVLSCTPKLVVYGRTPEEIFEPLLAAARQIDSEARGERHALQVLMPSVGVHLRIDGQRSLDYARVLAFEPHVSLRVWNGLLANLRQQLASDVASPPRRGFAMLAVAAGLGGLLLWQSFGNRELVVQGFRDWLWR
jgi:hypothetical protein